MDHKSDEEELNKSFLGSAEQVYTDKINFHRINIKRELNAFEKRKYFNSFDFTFINGNHYIAEKQLLVIDSRKPLLKKVAKITNPVAVVFSATDKEIPPELLKELPELKTLPQFSIEEIDKIGVFITTSVLDKPKLKGLVLVGGKSTRMGSDKAVLDYHGKPQWEYAKELLAPYCDEVFISVAEEAKSYKGTPQITDKFLGLGPMGGILSAFQEDPNSGWLVIACDLPLLSEKSLDHLVTKRNTHKMATSFKSPTLEFPEPLICIWEPKAYGTLLEYLSWGYSCPRKALINSDIELLISEHEEEMTNANTKEEFIEIKNTL
ncbi:hypothetical protein EI427_10275 [Flammeovirga pectinis]|uniref:Probable molybdenum cofactor guanylyltransferase n=2 Tax=Flammeovirga pectinis TaxID=2494373 RepID=A0A3S9P8P4_9BACT|nr:hypothetical protein EI427_10275 [Flammeovirga pectinis]